jgi:NAD-dependent SIR2 family protein deacetylase
MSEIGIYRQLEIRAADTRAWLRLESEIPMSRNVFILGAGASVQAGAPTMNTFIRVAQNIQRGNTPKLYPKEQECFDLVFKARTALTRTHSKSVLNIDNIESLFGAFDMAALLGRLGTLTGEEVQRLPSAVRYVIAKTIESSLRYPVNAGGLTLPPEPYDDFADIIRKLVAKDQGSVSVITFNYDVGLDYAFHFKSVPFEYRCGVPTGVNPGKKQSPGAVDLLKLHGSLNWGLCEKCHRVVPFQLKDFFAQYTWVAGLDKPHTRTIEIATHLVKVSCELCGTLLAENPVIVPPTWNKGNVHTGLSSVWMAAASHLAAAENVFIIGYSLPPTDEFFRYFYSLSTVGDTVFNTFSVVDTNKQVFERFKSILGQTAHACFVPIENTFGSALPQIRQILLPT